MPTEMELTLEQTQQGVSYEVSVDPHGFEGYLKMVVKVKNFKKDATLKLSKSRNQEWYEHVGPEVTRSQDDKGDGSSSEEWRDYGMTSDDYEGPPVFDDDQYEDVIEKEEGFVDNYLNFQKDKTNVSFSGVVLGVEEESMPVYDTNIEDAIEDEEGFVGKRGFGDEEDNMEDVVVMANDLCSSKIQTVIVDFSKTLDSNPHELILLQKGNLVEVSIFDMQKYQETYLKVTPMDDKFGFKLIKVRGRVIIKKGVLMQGIQMWMLRVKGTREEKFEDEFFSSGEE
ncbi:hypothetical protein Tco_0369233 [Tanacetum coccineum]